MFLIECGLLHFLGGAGERGRGQEREKEERERLHNFFKAVLYPLINADVLL